MSNQKNKKRANKKLFLFSLIITSFIFMVLLTGIVAVSAADVAYIYKNKLSIDNNFKKLFTDMGLTVETIPETKVTTTDFSKYKFIFVNDERFSYPNKIPIDKYPSVITNYFYGYQWGLTDFDGVSQLARTEPLSVRMNGTDQIVQVYTEAMFDMSGVAIPYFYLANGDKAAGMINVAGTYSGDQYNLGDVISYANEGTKLKNGKTIKGKICFFGLVESNYWTEDAKQMARECLGFVATVCSKNSDCGDEKTSAPYCKDGDVYEDLTKPVCMNSGTVLSQCSNEVTSKKINSCLYGCLNDQCKPQCTSSDLTNCEDESYSDNYCKDGDVVKDHIIPSCSLINTCLTDINIESVETCPFGCENGECIVTCDQNSDCGTDGLLGQEFCKDNNVFDKEIKHTCNMPGTKNSFCATATNEKLIETCSDKCLDGECVIIDCYDNDDCDDSNSHTQDTCLNPGTPQSSCENKPIDCLNNAECGTDGFLGQLFCKDNDVFDKYKKYTCLNPGTTESSCTDSTEDKLFAECPNKCAGGECIRCTVNSDCEDNNFSTQDTCLNPGTPQSSCQNLPIKCSTNSQCGTDGFTGNKYCLGGDSYEDFVTYTCNSPGTSQSSCTSSTKPVLKKNCESECVNGECIACFNNANCGTDAFLGSAYCSGKSIFQDYKTYTCLNPGTKDSECTDSTENKLKQTCPGTCFKGQCKDIKCNSNIDCDDNDEYTEDECSNPGTTSSYCSHTLYNCITDMDCGITGFSGEELCMIDNLFKMYYKSKCVNAATTNSYCDNSVIQKLIVDCGKDSCDSYGPNYCKSGSVYHSKTCYDRGCANQACFANPSSDEQLVEQCSNGCNDGVCNQNSCLDKDLDGYDVCSPGTPGDDGKPADCNDANANVHPNAIELCNGIDDDCDGQIDEGGVCVVECSKNSDCGTNHFLNQLFCKNNNVFDKYIVYMCHNPGTTDSSCMNHNEDKLKQTCGEGEICDNGECVPVNIQCYNDYDCDDADAYTLDKCLYPATPQSLCTHTPILCLTDYDCDDSLSNTLDKCNLPGTPQSYCTNTPVECNKNSDCGVNGFTGNKYCFWGNSYEDYISYTCNNAGTGSSYCSQDITPILQEYCNFACVSGDCISCFSNLDCGTDGYIGDKYCYEDNVYQDYEQFSCWNPGTGDSMCISDVFAELIEECAYGCLNGECNQNECIDNDADGYDTCNPGDPGDDGNPKDCNDNNPEVHPNAIEICNLIDDNCDGQIDEGGVCVCSQDSDCGTNHFLNQLFCKDNNVFDKFITYKCNNPGTLLNSCSDSISDVLKQACEQGQTCSNGACVNNCICNPQQIIFSNNQIYNDANSKIAPISCSSVPGAPASLTCDGGYYPDQSTANKLCKKKGYESAVSFTTQDHFFTSCTDNYMWKWNLNSAENIWACIKNTGIDSVTCSKNICTGNCPAPPVPCQPETKSFSSGAEIRDFVNSLGLYTHIPNDNEANTGAIRYDSVSVSKVCELTGKPNVVSSATSSYTSCHDNAMAYWAGSDFVIEPACNDNLMVDKLTCSKQC